ncbi:F0F1 ATP synthase subunit epsilon [Falsarthrobacter nasiphocae]|uniref:ATP synthase epsilon chain n=1 Tax=Falsarthrobacter nasiphocae TaxID=189863 RepID=A0AAE3YIR5_9MICC|nr:F0F1 ATP synthase subunit epsilon [Falsarthrobacter nasiphocae]MDR6892781.1 F-type H+-transporting ATPase subunit epsilon [Falsarthrobacter nasiphocae]
MAASELHVEIVAPDSQVWSGAASMIRVRTTEGEIGILPGHQPLLAVLGAGELVVAAAGGAREHFHADGGFLSVEGDGGRVIVVADNCTRTEAPAAGPVSVAS